MRGSRTRRSVTSTYSSVCSSDSALQPQWTVAVGSVRTRRSIARSSVGW